MKVVSLALLYLGSVSFFGVEAAKLNGTINLPKWIAHLWRPSQGAKELQSPGWKLPLGGIPPSFVRTQDVKGEPGMAQPSSLEASGRVRVKRHPQAAYAAAHFQNLRAACRLGTCNVQNLAHTLFHFTDKDKDSSAPPGKLTAAGYGRRRRSAADRPPTTGPEVALGAKSRPRPPQALLKVLAAASSRPKREPEPKRLQELLRLLQ